MPQTQAYEAFGPHLIVDGYGCQSEVLVDAGKIRRFLVAIPDQIGMTPISPVVVMATKEGTSGFVIIAESHIVVHTLATKGIARLDIFSCKKFDTEKATALFEESFGPFKKKVIQLLDRGLEFPRNIGWVKRHVREDVLEVFDRGLMT